MALHDLIDAKKIPAIPIFVDSPMALASLNQYRDAVTADAPEIKTEFKDLYRHTDPFNPGTLEEMNSTDQSKSLNGRSESGIIISASGMATGGRVVHHLANMLPDPKNTVILVGFQATGSRGRALEQGAKTIRIHGDQIPVSAHIAKVESFSVHADSDELIRWLRGIEKPERAFVVHGEPDSSNFLAQRITTELGWKAEVPQFGRAIAL
jgi:metallo-beta-lactamase family protein